MVIQKSKSENTGEIETASAVAIGAALAFSLSVPVGIAVGIGLTYVSLRKRQKRLSTSEIGRLALVAVVVAFACNLLSNWADFKEGFEAGWRAMS